MPGSASRIRRIARYYRRVAHRKLRHAGALEYTHNLGVAVLIGLAGGYGAVLFRWLIDHVHWFFFAWMRQPLVFMGDAYVIVLPAIGGLVVGLLVRYAAHEVRGPGVAQVLEAVAAGGGSIRGRVAPVKAVASAICIGSGGSAGREGPIVQICSTLGSLAGKIGHASLAQRRTFVACGAAAGIAATFNAPLAGVLFAQEIILGEFVIISVVPIVVAAVISSTIGHSAFGNVPAFSIPQYAFGDAWELPWFVALGVIAAITGVAFIRILYAVEGWVDRRHMPAWSTAAIGGLCVGLLGYHFPQVMGIGYDTVGEVLAGGGPAMAILFVLAVVKLVATSITLGSGGSGGIMAPSLFIGAMLGSGFGHLISTSPISRAPAFGLVGMAAVFSAAGHAPMSAIMTVFEMTQDYDMILPLMLACGVATVLARLLYRFSIYNLRMMQHQVHFSLGRDTRLLDQITVHEAMTTDLITLPPGMLVSDAVRLFTETKHHGFPIADPDGRLHGIISLGDVRQALSQRDSSMTVQEAGTHDVVVAFSDETLNDALRKLGLRDVGRLPVVDRNDHTRLLGLITRKNVISAYNRALLRLHTDLDETVRPEHIE